MEWTYVLGRRASLVRNDFRHNFGSGAGHTDASLDEHRSLLGVPPLAEVT